MLEQVVIAAGEVVNELIFPPVVFTLIAMAAFVALGAITYSYRNVANRHRNKVSSSSSAGHH